MESELLPLPERVEVDKHLPTGVRIYAYDANTLKNYARANMEPLRAEVKALKHDLDAYITIANTETTRAERLAEALRNIRRAALDGCSAMDCARDAYDALALEDRNG